MLSNNSYNHIFVSEKINKELKLIKFDFPVLFYKNKTTGELYTKDTIKYILGGEIVALYTFEQVLQWFVEKGYYHSYYYIKHKNSYIYAYDVVKNNKYVKNNYSKTYFTNLTELKEQLILFLIELVFKNGE